EAVAEIGSWVSEITATGRLLWSKQTYRMFGVDPKESVSVDSFYAMVHEADRDRVWAASRAAIFEGARYDIEHRIVRPSGEIRWMHERAAIVRSDRGEAVRM